MALLANGAEVQLIARDLGLEIRSLLRTEIPVRLLTAPEASHADLGNGPSHLAWAQVSQARDVADTLAALALSDWRPDFVVVDHYAFDARWHEAVRAATCARIAVVDDLGDRALAADLLVDHNWHPDHILKYSRRLTRPTQLLAGPTFALLDPTYATAPRYLPQVHVASIGVFMGGSDAADAASRVLDAIEATVFNGRIELVSTSANPNLSRLEARLSNPNLTLTLDQPDLAAFFARHDLHVGAGGGATWERFCIGAPSILLSFARNHDHVLEPLRDLGLAAVLPMGWSQPDLVLAIESLLMDHGRRERFSSRGQSFVDGRGCERVADQLVNAE